LHDKGVDVEYTGNKQAPITSDYLIPDVWKYIHGRTELTISTIMRILTRSGRLDDLAVNPQLFMITTML